MNKGTVKFFNEEKGYGFITEDNSKENILKEGNIKHKHNALINRPIKDIILELAEGEITEEDYKFFFEED